LFFTLPMSFEIGAASQHLLPLRAVNAASSAIRKAFFYLLAPVRIRATKWSDRGC